jgi:hypothetical protein
VIFIYLYTPNGGLQTETCSLIVILYEYVCCNGLYNYNQPTYCCVDGPGTSDSYTQQDAKYCDVHAVGQQSQQRKDVA